LVIVSLKLLIYDKYKSLFISTLLLINKDMLDENRIKFF
jgi:hypothetical protein